jgi:thiol-disulfide isomerase/thioredoxin
MFHSNLSISEIQEKINLEKFVFIDFWAEWCAPCKQLNQLVSEIIPDFPQIEVIKINISELSMIDVIQKYKIKSVPTLMFYKNGMLGTRVEYTQRQHRTRHRKGPLYNQQIKEWSPEYVGKRTGIIVGIRILSNGINTYYSEDPTQYDPTEYFQVYLVVSNIYQKFDKVLPEDIKVIEEEVEK